MIVLHSEAEFTGKRSVVALGMFDGVHIGHQRLIRTAVALAKALDAVSVVCTFDCHPLSVLCPERAPEALLPLEENLAKFARLGADMALVRHFDRTFASMEPRDYLRLLTEQLRAKGIVIGENYTFGKMGRGNAETLLRCAKEFGYEARVVAPVMDGDRMASSTYIRELRRAGQWEHARRLMEIKQENDHF